MQTIISESVKAHGPLIIMTEDTSHEELPCIHQSHQFDLCQGHSSSIHIDLRNPQSRVFNGSSSNSNQILLDQVVNSYPFLSLISYICGHQGANFLFLVCAQTPDFSR